MPFSYTAVTISTIVELTSFIADLLTWIITQKANVMKAAVPPPIMTPAQPVISASLSDSTPGLGVQPLSTTLILDGQAVTPQVSTASGFAYAPTQRLVEGSHAVVARTCNHDLHPFH